MGPLKISRTLGLILAGLLLFQLADAQYKIPQSVFGNGGQPVTGGSNRINGTLAQTVVGRVSGASNRNDIGFWYGTGTLAAPTLVSPTNGTGGHSTQVTLSWNSVPGATSYRLQVSTTLSFATTVVDPTLVGTSHLVGSLSQDVTYYWRVRAQNAIGVSAYSMVWSFLTYRLFSDVAIGAGVHDSIRTHENEGYIYSGALEGGRGIGAAWGDYNNDGRLDLYLSNQYNSSMSTNRPNRLYYNNGNGTFTRMPQSTGVNYVNSNEIAVPLQTPYPKYTISAVWGDYDNDGDLDLYSAAGTNGSRLYRNEGGWFQFINDNVTTGGIGPGAAWGDYDNDSYLDLCVSNHLYHNNGNGTFSYATGTGVGVGNGAAWGDYDNDGDLDLYVMGRLNRNNGNGTFTDVAGTAGVSNIGENGYGSVWGDYDNDGDLDLYLTGGKLYRNNGGPSWTFTDVAANAGIYSSVGSAAWGDYDNDGYLDLFSANRYLYHNNGNGTFTEVGTSLGITWTYTPHAASWGDYDNDGDLDLFATSGNAVSVNTANRLYRNNGNANRWLIVKLEGTASNRSGIGARVTAVTGALRQRRDVDGGSGYQSQPSLPVEFGFGATTTVDSLIVRWPSGIVQVVQTNLATNQIITATEQYSVPKPTVSKKGRGGLAKAGEDSVAIPEVFGLDQGYPNPFNPATTIRYALPEAVNVTLVVYNILGQRVRTLVRTAQGAGYYRVVWDGRDEAGAPVSSGVYLYRLQAGSFVQVRKVLMIR